MSIKPALLTLIVLLFVSSLIKEISINASSILYEASLFIETLGSGGVKTIFKREALSRLILIKGSILISSNQSHTLGLIIRYNS